MGSTFATSLGQGVATQAATNALNFPFSVAGSAIGYAFGEKAADKADMRQRAQFHDMYSTAAQMEQIKKAGLSPSLMYGGSPSQGGATAPQGNGAYATHMNLASISPTDVAQMQKTDAERRLIEAEIENKKQDTQNKGAELNKIVQEYENEKVQYRIYTAEADIAECNADLTWATFEANLASAYSNSAKAAAEARSAGVKADLDETTFDAAYQMAWAELDAKLSEAALNRAEIGLTKAQIKQISWNIWETQKEQYRKDKQFNQDLDKLKNEVKLELMKLNQGAEKIIADMSATKINAVSHIVGSLLNMSAVGMYAKRKGK